MLHPENLSSNATTGVRLLSAPHTGGATVAPAGGRGGQPSRCRPPPPPHCLAKWKGKTGRSATTAVTRSATMPPQPPHCGCTDRNFTTNILGASADPHRRSMPLTPPPPTPTGPPSHYAPPPAGPRSRLLCGMRHCYDPPYRELHKLHNVSIHSRDAPMSPPPTMSPQPGQPNGLLLERKGGELIL